MKRWCLTIAAVGCAPVAAFANDWGMGDSNSKIPPSSVFNAVSTPAHEINTVAFFVISITAVIFLIVAGLLSYSIVLFLTTARTIYTVQAATRPAGAISVHVIAHQWWWEFRYPALGVVTANEL